MQPNAVKEESSKEETPTWAYNDEGSDAEDTVTAPKGDTITWTASEFIAHNKTALWYLVLVGITVVLAVIMFLITDGDIVSIVVVAIMAILFGYTASRKPRELPYRIDSKGLTIDKKLYTYASFKSFSLVQESEVESIWLLPLQRFSPGLSIYFAPDEKDKIMNTLSEYLPVEERKLDIVDTLMHKIRF